MFFKKYIINKYNIIRIIAGFVIGILVAILNVASVNGWKEVNCYRNALFLGAFVCALLAILSILANFGTFDIFSYYPTRKTINGKKEDYPAFTERKKSERETSKFAFIVYLMVGVVLCAAACVTFLIK